MSASATRDRHGRGRNIMARMLHEIASLQDIERKVDKRKKARNV